MNWRKDSHGWASRLDYPVLRVNASPEGFKYNVKWDFKTRFWHEPITGGPFETPEEAEREGVLHVMRRFEELGSVTPGFFSELLTELHEHLVEDMLEPFDFTPHKRSM